MKGRYGTTSARPVKDDKQRDFVTLCRGMGIRTVAGFMDRLPGRQRRFDSQRAALREGSESDVRQLQPS